MKNRKRKAKPGAKARGGEIGMPSAEQIAQAKQRVIKALDAMAADHSTYFDAFIGTWECATENIGNLAGAFLAHRNAGFTDEHIRAFVKPYSVEFAIMYSRITGTFAANERELFRRTVEEHKEAWARLCAAMSARLPQFKEECAAIERNSALAADFLFKLYTGETEETLTPEFLGWMDTMLAALVSIRKEVLP